ncbi:unnamed protein product [Clavelina lepadiformis]|uniref:Uncharacterized protein n=1 Tax=Clavelina lepadiformis TaxID=159417 RepID=A0ABP0H210_CLALP
MKAVIVVLCLCVLVILAEETPDTAKFEVKVNCPEGHDCHKHIQERLDSLKEHGIHATLEHMKENEHGEL